MNPKNRQALAARIAKAAAAAVQSQGYVSPVDVLQGIGWVAPAHVADWRNRRLPFLEKAIQTNLSRVAEAMRLFRQWAAEAGLQPAEVEYVARSARRERLRFSKSGQYSIERAYRTHWLSKQFSAKQRARVEEKMSRPPELVAVAPRNTDWRCHRCGGSGALLVMEPPGPACLACAGLGDLEELPAGDALLTRRARRASARSAVIVRWSRSRKRYERIGVLVEAGTLAAERARIARERGTADDPELEQGCGGEPIPF